MENNLYFNDFFYKIRKSQTILPFKKDEIKNTIQIIQRGVEDYEILKKDKKKYPKMIQYYKKLKKITKLEQIAKHLTLQILFHTYYDNIIPPYEKLIQDLKKKVKGLTIYNFILKINEIKSSFYNYNNYLEKIHSSFQKNYKKLENLSEEEIRKHKIYRKYFLLVGFPDFLKNKNKN